MQEPGEDLESSKVSFKNNWISWNNSSQHLCLWFHYTLETLTVSIKKTNDLLLDKRVSAISNAMPIAVSPVDLLHFVELLLEMKH